MKTKNQRMAVERLKIAVLERTLAKAELENRNANILTPWKSGLAEGTVGASSTWMNGIRERIDRCENEICRLSFQNENEIDVENGKDIGESVPQWERTIEILQEELL